MYTQGANWTKETSPHPHVQPRRLPKHGVLSAPVELLKKEWAILQRRGVITPVETIIEGISSLVEVRKPSDKFRICIDHKPLNRALKRHHCPLPTIEDILLEQCRANVFTVCDIKNTFWHTELNEPSNTRPHLPHILAGTTGYKCLWTPVQSHKCSNVNRTSSRKTPGDQDCSWWHSYYRRRR